MASNELQRLCPGAAPELLALLDPRRGPVEPPNRSEIFGRERFAQHGRSLAATHHADAARSRKATFFPRLRENVRVLREAHRYIGAQAKTGYDVSPAAEWLLDNFHLIEAQLKEIHDGLPRRYYRDLPLLTDEPLAGLPRVYSVAWAFVAHTDGAFDEALLTSFLQAYQSERELSLGELWALPTTLRVVLVENLRRLSERVATNKAARALANLCCDRIDEQGPIELDAVLALVERRGAARTFLSQIAQRMQDPRNAAQLRMREWLHRVMPDVAQVQTQQPAEQAADNLSVSNAIGSLRLIGNADWPEIVSRTSTTMQLLLSLPAFEAESDDTRNATLHEIERLARRSGRSETVIARTLFELTHRDAADPARAAPSHWLHGPGRAELVESFGLDERGRRFARACLRHAALPAYLGTIAAGTAGVVAWLLLQHSAALPGAALPSADAPLWIALLTAVLMLFPTSEAVVALVNRLISESVKPVRLPRLAFAHGIPAEHRVIVVIPGLLTSPTAATELAHRLEQHYLANPEANAQFALLTDWADAPTQALPSDGPVLDAAARHVGELNMRHPVAEGRAARFLVLHRERRYSRTERRWIGWERKRGKLEQLIDLLVEPEAADAARAFIDLGVLSRVEAHTRYVVTLDGDTQLPPSRLRELVGVAAHPHNEPQVDAQRRCVRRGYGILQPRVVTPLPSPENITAYHWLFAGQCGIDPYSAASSEVYQDVFGEGTFTGKGLLNVQAMHKVLGRRLPDGRVLSHDLLEGSLARCAAVTDITVVEDAPFHADVAASRVHRWTRGDWQLLPFMLRAGRYPTRAINRWKMFDNLRRSLVAPMSLALMLLALGTGVVSPWTALVLIGAAFIAGPLMGSVAAFAPSRDEIAMRRFFAEASVDLLRALLSGAWLLAQLLQHSLMNLDAVLRALYRMTLSKRHLLEWTTAASAQANASTRLGAIARKHWAVPPVAIALLAGLWWAGSPTPVLAAALCIVWGAAPIWTWWVSRPRPKRRDASLPLADQAYLEGMARDTWRLFERCVGAEDNHLPPDNLQLTPHAMVAHRTSPTNIGLYLLSAACARRFGWIGTQELLQRAEATLETLAELPRHRGHFLNWYDTQRAVPLLPMYVSTVDSGNLSGHLLALAQACIEFAGAPYDEAPVRRALAIGVQRIAALRSAAPALASDGAIVRLLALSDPLRDARIRPDALQALLRAARDELKQVLPDVDAPGAYGATERFGWCLADHIATLHSALLDQRCEQSIARGETPPRGDPSKRLLGLSTRCRRLAWEADFAFLYHRKRQLFHIGYRVAEQQLDTSFYDLLASESRLTSVLAIAKGDVPVSHWAALGRPFYAVGAHTALRSWSGSMFEYLMPSMVLDEPHGSVLRDACCACLREQIDFARQHRVPWGISESAYAASDHTLAYQYAPQGVPRLALRRTPADELVIAPYATALAAQIAPHGAVANFTRLEALRARGRYGFIDALDFTPSRQAEAEGVSRVETFMAHHQGMTIVSLANVLLDNAPRRWSMANPHIEAVTSLLHERAPREVSVLLEPPPEAPLAHRERRGTGLVREIVPGVAALAPTHLLSNGRYNVALRPNGAGWSRWGNVGITRSRDDLLRDAYGSFFHLRWDRQPQAVSITQHPAPDPSAHYQCNFHADRVCFDARWPEIQAHTTVWVSPEDDIEFREIELRNLSDRPIELELMSAFQITLAEPRADEAHPAFSNLFLRAQWRPAQHAVVWERKPRLPTEAGLRAAHFLVDPGRSSEQLRSIGVQADRGGWLGRNRDASRPLGKFDAAPTGDPTVLDTGLDPVSALCVGVSLAPRSVLHLVFCTAASDNAATLDAVIDKYRQHGPVERASLMSATLARIRLRELRIGAETFAAIQSLTTALVTTVTRAAAADAAEADASSPGASAPRLSACDRRTLWRFGISGDRPIVLVSAGVAQGLGLVRALTQALRVWAWGGVACDLVVVNAEPSSYLMALQRELTALRDSQAAEGASGNAGAAGTSFQLLRRDELSELEMATLHAFARIHINADGRPLTHHVQEWMDAHEASFDERLDLASVALEPVDGAGPALRVVQGRFTDNGSEFRFDVNAFQRPPRPWVNVIANPQFGTQLSEAGGGYTWGLNSRLNQLTPWSNDPVADPPGEWFVVQDLKTREAWSVTPSAWGDPSATYRIAHGQGHSTITHRRGDLDIETSCCVDPDTSIKQIRIAIVNRGQRRQRLRVLGLAEWVMGGGRSDRLSTDTGTLSQRLPDTAVAADDGASQARRLTALLCTQRDRAGGFGEATAFLALAEDLTEHSADWTCDRRELFDARGRIVVPDHLGRRCGVGFDPCAALSTQLTLGAGESAQCVFLLGFAVNPDEARTLATEAIIVDPAERLERARARWDELLGAATVRTPDPLFDAMVNRWLLYQTVSCRLWAKAGFYQAGGAFGFRDQLQDAMALAWADPATLRAQIVLNASRQFREGDVQHWWHAPTGAGVRTHFSDDLLWLVHATLHYLQCSEDAALLDESIGFIEGASIPEGAEDAYYVPSASDEHATLYEHCARTIERSLATGAHGLPLMGTGDWNDGMNRVGHEGRGESVWLAWFLCDLVVRFAPIARMRGEVSRAERWESAASGWRHALQAEAWDGQWYKRAFFDNGSPLGSHENEECRIDLIAQAWAVISNVAPPAFRRMALTALDTHLVDRDAGLIRLLHPPLHDAQPSAGYIQAYPPGVRENGGQYSHAGVWALIAQAQSGHGDTAYRYFTYLSPAHRTPDIESITTYAIEPYVMAGDIYSQPPYVGRGGWSWYTGSAAWMHRAAIESMFGLTQQGSALRFTPCLPSHWPEVELTLRRGDASVRVIFARSDASRSWQAAEKSGAMLVASGESVEWELLAKQGTALVRLEAAPRPQAGAVASYSLQGGAPMSPQRHDP